MAVSQLHDDVKQVADPQKRGRQYVASRLEKLAGTRMGGFVLTRQAAVGKWGKATYALKETARSEDHRGHWGHRDEEQRFDHSDGARPMRRLKVYAPYEPYARLGAGLPGLGRAAAMRAASHSSASIFNDVEGIVNRTRTVLPEIRLPGADSPMSSSAAYLTELNREAARGGGAWRGRGLAFLEAAGSS